MLKWRRTPKTSLMWVVAVVDVVYVGVDGLVLVLFWLLVLLLW